MSLTFAKNTIACSGGSRNFQTGEGSRKHGVWGLFESPQWVHCKAWWRPRGEADEFLHVKGV